MSVDSGSQRSVIRRCGHCGEDTPASWDVHCRFCGKNLCQDCFRLTGGRSDCEPRPPVPSANEELAHVVGMAIDHACYAIANAEDRTTTTDLLDALTALCNVRERLRGRAST